MNRARVYDFKDKYSKLTDEDLIKLSQQITKIKNYSIKNLKKLKDEAVKNFEQNGIIVHEAESCEEASEIVKKLTENDELIIKSKSNTATIAGIEHVLKNKEVVETDLGDFVSKITGKRDIHPVLPSLSLSSEEISRAINEKFNEKVESTPESIAKWVRNHLREKIIKAKTGLTGANILTAEGEIVLLENEGNISLVSRWPDKHIVIAGVEKIVPTGEDALKICKALANWGTGQNKASYVSFIAGPSKTADIENTVITGAQGAKEVHLVLLDLCKEYIDKEIEEILKCINCGACISLCPAFHTSKIESQYSGIKIMAIKYLKNMLDKEMPFMCTTCGMCTNICPVGINLREVLLKIRSTTEQPENNKKMLEQIKKYGNPFGEKPEESEELYCC